MSIFKENQNVLSPSSTGVGNASLTGRADGVINIGSGQFYKDETGRIGFGVIPSTANTLSVSGGILSSGSLTSGSQIFLTNIAQNEKIRVVGDSSFFAFFDNANTTRRGYLQGNTSNIALQAENGNLTLGSSSVINLVGNTTNTGSLLVTGSGAFNSSLSVTGSLTSGNVVTGTISASGNITGTNETLSGSLTSGNVVTGTISASGNITGTNETLSGSLTSGNVVTGTISASGITASTAVFSGNVSANQFNGPATKLISNTSTANSSFNILFSDSTDVFKDTDLNYNPGGNLLSVGSISATGTISALNLGATTLNSTTATFNSLAVTGSSTFGNINTGTISASGNITGTNETLSGSLTSGSVVTGTISASGNITGTNETLSGNLTAANGIISNSLSVSGNITAANQTLTGNLAVVGNITANIVTSKTTAKAWVVFDGTLTIGNIKSSYNVQAVTKNGTGIYTVTFQSGTFSSSDYVWSGSAGGDGLGSNNHIAGNNNSSNNSLKLQNDLRIYCLEANIPTLEDATDICIVAFGN